MRLRKCINGVEFFLRFTHEGYILYYPNIAYGDESTRTAILQTLEDVEKMCNIECVKYLKDIKQKEKDMKKLLDNDWSIYKENENFVTNVPAVEKLSAKVLNIGL